MTDVRNITPFEKSPGRRLRPGDLCTYILIRRKHGKSLTATGIIKEVYCDSIYLFNPLAKRNYMIQLKDAITFEPGEDDVSYWKNLNCQGRVELTQFSSRKDYYGL
jgi:hypothetical protein